ncbi:MAG: DUF362 domain-containing protein [Methanomicrobiaceae archaeon]|nr:DUF362 domain-containing protein [Methanomicrobiaceae archaeon]
MGTGKTTVTVVSAEDRKRGIRESLGAHDPSPYRGARVLLKANFNSADPFPARTHIETVRSLFRWLQEAGAANVTLAERSGMGATRRVLERCGVFTTAEEYGASLLVLDEMESDGWIHSEDDDLSWSRGFFIARIAQESERVVQTCCLKTHRFGGDFTMSLKNSVGLVAKRVPGSSHDYMQELHSSPDQRRMIAEINRYYPVDLIVLDATDAFASGGPEAGSLIHPGIIITGTDRVAVDAVGIAVLRIFGSTPEVTEGGIFSLEQIARAAELGIGVGDAAEITVRPLDQGSTEITGKIQALLEEEG